MFLQGTTGGYLVHKLEPHTNMGYRFKARVSRPSLAFLLSPSLALRASA